ncbi:DUF4055 domain-containing protein [Halomonas sp. MS1]|nr:DUF4055 domain-containing protein [Halomonas sp. MS1]UTD55948.1 DUF4055 domain-containing protein [Halomonas sp. MS1]
MAVTSQNEQYTAMLEEWQEMEDALVGPRAISAGGIIYLSKTSGMIEAESLAATDNSPLTPAQAKQLYDAYKRRAEYPLWVKDSLRTMVGLVSRQEPEIQLPNQMSDLLNEATSDGFSLKQLYLRIVAALLTKGRKPLLAEFDDNGKPYIATYTAETAPNWLTSDAGGRQDLTLVVFTEQKLKAGADEFAPEYETVYRVLDLQEGLRYRVRIMNEAGVEIEDTEYPGLIGGTQSTPLKFIPAVFAGSTDNNADVDEIPLQTMAKAALKYYQLSADYYTAMHYTAHPQPWIAMNGDGDMRVTGPMAAWMLPENGKCGYLEFTGAGIEKLRQAMQDQQNAAAESGAKTIDIGGMESGEARKARQNDQYSALYSVCVNGAEALEQMLRYIAYWKGMKESEVAEQVIFKVEPKFSKEEVDAAMLQVVYNIVMADRAPNEVLFESMRKAGLTDMSDDELVSLMTTGGLPLPEGVE